MVTAGMPIRLILSRKLIEIKNADKKALKIIEAATSYLQTGYKYNGAWKNHYWDGRTRMLEFERDHYEIGIGMLGEVTRALTEADLTYEIKRRPEREPVFVEYEWNESICLRPYQQEAVAAFLAAPNRARGILKMPIRSGKTKTASFAIYELHTTALFVVPSQMLLRQTIEAIKESLPGANVGQIGDGIWKPGDVTVATVQSLLAAKGGKQKTCKGNLYDEEICPCGKKVCKGGRKYLTPMNPVYRKFMEESHDFLIVDELHHYKQGAWGEVVRDSNAKYRLGLSATVYFDMRTEVEAGVLWVKSCTGDIKHTVDVSDLIEQGFLMRQNVKLYKVTEPKELLDVTSWKPEILNKGIYANEVRNKLIIDLAAEQLRKGVANVMLSTNRLEQVAALDALLERAHIDHGVITGSTPKETRADLIAEFKRGGFPVLLGTVFGEGIDIPECECVINAEGGKDAKKTVQRMRSMTIMDGKKHSIMIDFYDSFNKFTKKHSNARIKTYKEERAFLVEKINF